MAMGGTDRGEGAIAGINITPLIDVMLVLLVIFMLVTPVARRGLDTALPRKDSAVPTPGPPVPVMVIVERAAFVLDGIPVAGGAELEGRLRTLVAPRRDKTVFVRAGGGVPYARVIEAVDAAKGAGAERIGLVPDAPAETGQATGS